jgi:hypothetical protein
VTVEPPKRVSSPKILLDELKKAAHRLLLNTGNQGLGSRVRSWLLDVIKNDRAVGAQGIVLGGRVATEARLRDNTIDGFVQGIHAGISHRRTAAQETAGTPADQDRMSRLLIEHNTILVAIPIQTVRERHGIFVGNCDSATIVDNYVNIDRSLLPDIKVEGIRIFGTLGRRVMVRGNQLDGCTLGVLFHPLTPLPTGNNAGKRDVQWIVDDNVAIGAAPLLNIEPSSQIFRVKQTNNLS